MNNINKQELNQEDLLEILEIAKEVNNSARELCKMGAEHNKKWRKKLESHQAIIQK